MFKKMKKKKERTRSRINPQAEGNSLLSDDEKLEAPPRETPVQVFVRLRPESRDNRLLCRARCLERVAEDPYQVRCHRFDLKKEDKPVPVHAYRFHGIFGEECGQNDVYRQVVGDMCEGLFQGINAAIIACGQTGSGKTHTMMGPPSLENVSVSPEAGLIPRVLSETFAHARPFMALPSKYDLQMHASFFEIYLENVFDLLADWRQKLNPRDVESTLSNRKGLDLFQGPQGDLLVKDGIQIPVSSAHDALSTFEDGRRVRIAGSTCSNHYSSRGHALFVLTTVLTDKEEGSQWVSQLYLCDLAGSERLSKTEATGHQLREGTRINHSILTLGKVISALTATKPTGGSGKKPHVPYRDSKLTRFLENALGGNGRSSLIMCTSPDFADCCETDATLLLGARSRQIQNIVVANMRRSVEELESLLTRSDAKIAAQQAEIEELKARLIQYQRHCHCRHTHPDLLSIPLILEPPKEKVAEESGEDEEYQWSLADLPAEIMSHIGTFLTGTELMTMRCTSRRHYAVLSYEPLWKAALAKEFSFHDSPGEVTHFQKYCALVASRRGNTVERFRAKKVEPRGVVLWQPRTTLPML